MLRCMWLLNAIVKDGFRLLTQASTAHCVDGTSAQDT